MELENQNCARAFFRRWNRFGALTLALRASSLSFASLSTLRMAPVPFWANVKDEPRRVATLALATG